VCAKNVFQFFPEAVYSCQKIDTVSKVLRFNIIYEQDLLMTIYDKIYDGWLELGLVV
jgi:hypothetical protein